MIPWWCHSCIPAWRENNVTWYAHIWMWWHKIKKPIENVSTMKFSVTYLHVGQECFFPGKCKSVISSMVVNWDRYHNWLCTLEIIAIITSVCNVSEHRSTVHTQTGHASICSVHGGQVVPGREEIVLWRSNGWIDKEAMIEFIKEQSSDIVKSNYTWNNNRDDPCMCRDPVHNRGFPGHFGTTAVVT